jgi:hypothetical protein
MSDFAQTMSKCSGVTVEFCCILNIRDFNINAYNYKDLGIACWMLKRWTLEKYDKMVCGLD